MFDVSCPLSFSSLCLHFSSPPWQPTSHFPLYFDVFFKVLAGMNVHPAEFDGLKQEYNVKGYPTFCYFEWVESSHPSHLRLSPHFQGSEHQSRATSNGKVQTPTDIVVNLQLAMVALEVQNLLLPGVKEKVSEKLWDPPLKKVNSQEGVNDVVCSWVPLSASEIDTQVVL